MTTELTRIFDSLIADARMRGNRLEGRRLLVDSIAACHPDVRPYRLRRRDRLFGALDHLYGPISRSLVPPASGLEIVETPRQAAQDSRQRSKPPQPDAYVDPPRPAPLRATTPAAASIDDVGVIRGGI